LPHVIEIPVEGGRLLVQAAEDPAHDADDPSSPSPGFSVHQAAHSLSDALDQLRPAVETLHHGLSTMAPDETTVEFGIVLGGEAGVIVARGKAEVHFSVTLSWKRNS
jgi:hypothetical protein